VLLPAGAAKTVITPDLADKRRYGKVNSVGPEAAPAVVKALRELLEGK
jgi:hypothetical protein